MRGHRPHIGTVQWDPSTLEVAIGSPAFVHCRLTAAWLVCAHVCSATDRARRFGAIHGARKVIGELEYVRARFGALGL
eukprot:2842298-Prymnesium_polylepis.1